MHPEALSALQTRITELETQLAYQEHTLEALNRVITELATKLELQQAQLRYLYEQQQNASPTMRGNLREEIPPHY